MATTLHDDEAFIKYDFPLTILSIVPAVVCCHLGMHIGTRDYFYGPDRVAKLKNLVSKTYTMGEIRKKKGKGYIYKLAYFGQLQNLFGGALLTALGCCLMHFG